VSVSVCVSLSLCVRVCICGGEEEACRQSMRSVTVFVRSVTVSVCQCVLLMCCQGKKTKRRV
jgi:hypothetical protein